MGPYILAVIMISIILAPKAKFTENHYLYEEGDTLSFHVLYVRALLDVCDDGLRIWWE
jgi:hypothetical protein